MSGAVEGAFGSAARGEQADRPRRISHVGESISGGNGRRVLAPLLEADEPPGFGPPLHIHHDASEAFYVLEGDYVMFLDDDREVSCPAGSFIFIPAGRRHGFRVGSLASRKLNVYLPAAMVGYFDELSEAANSDRIDDEMVSAIARRYSMEVVGPVPEGYA